MNEVNGLPIGFFVVAGGIILVLAAWVLMRFGKVIARGVLVVAGLVIGLVIALAVLAQGAASVSTAQSAERVAKVAQTNATSNLVMVGALGCVGGVATLAVIGAVGFAGYVWIKGQQAERAQRQLPRQQAQGALPPQQEPVIWYVGQEQQAQAQVQNADLSQYGW